MKYIIKGSEPAKFSAWKRRRNNPRYTDRDNPKKIVKEKLSSEQGYLCCYCEGRLLINESHIEHVRPQSSPGVDPLDFSNMACSCLKNSRRGDPLHCGKKKGNWYDPNRFVSPFDPTCERRFVYHANGAMLPMNGDLAAETTIAKLGLNIPKLQALRKAAIDPFLDPNLSDAELVLFAKGYLERDDQGRFNPYWTTIRTLFET